MSFLEALKNKKNSGSIPVIPDIKVFSPKDGELMGSRDPVGYAKMLEAAGAPVLSVVTEEKEFHGSLRMLEEICKSVHIPVLRKDFVEELRDLDETVQAGASAVLLMVSCLGEEKLAFFYEEAKKRGLMPLVETHTARELDFALQLGAPLVGINNRNILQLERDDGDVSVAEELLSKEEMGKSGIGTDKSEDRPFIIVESALKDAQDVRLAIRSGADGALVGTALLRAEAPEKLYQAMSRRTALKICGIMNEKDAEFCAENCVDMAGFVTEYPVDVPWNLSAENAKKLISRIRGRIMTCIVTGGSEEKVLRLGKELKPDYVQLHYTETAKETQKIAESLHCLGIKVIRSIPSDPVVREKMFSTESITEIIALLDHSAVDEILLDSRDAGNATAGGDPILTQLSEEVLKAAKACGKPVMAGGGITEENAAQIQSILQADCIDVMTGSEVRPGQKSEEKILALLDALK